MMTEQGVGSSAKGVEEVTLEHEAEENPPLPPVPTHKPRYDRARVREGMSYANFYLARRNVMPITKSCFSIYHAQCIDHLEHLSEMSTDEVSASQGTIREMETIIQANEFLRPMKDDDRKAFIDKCVDLRKLHIFARYGDYWSYVLTTVRNYAREYQVEGAQNIGEDLRWSEIAQNLRTEMGNEFWVKIAQKIESEKPEWDEDRRKCPTTIALWQTARELKIDFHRLKNIVFLYATRNGQFHTGLADAIQNGQHTEVARMLCADLREVEYTFTINEVGYKASIQACIQALKHEWFQVAEGEEWLPDRWLPSSKFIGMYTKGARGYTPQPLSSTSSMLASPVNPPSIGHSVSAGLKNVEIEKDEHNALLQIFLQAGAQLKKLPDLTLGRDSTGFPSNVTKPKPVTNAKNRAAVRQRSFREIRDLWNSIEHPNVSYKRSLAQLRAVVVQQDEFESRWACEREEPIVAPGDKRPPRLKTEVKGKGNAFSNVPPKPRLPEGWTCEWVPSLKKWLYHNEKKDMLTYHRPQNEKDGGVVPSSSGRFWTT